MGGWGRGVIQKVYFMLTYRLGNAGVGDPFTGIPEKYKDKAGDIPHYRPPKSVFTYTYVDFSDFQLFLLLKAHAIHLELSLSFAKNKNKKCNHVCI